MWPRFNGACASSRLGKIRAAAKELRALLREDLPRFRRRFFDDPDLETLRASEDGKALAGYIDRVAKEYVAALGRGAPAFMYKEREGEIGDYDDQRYQTPYYDLRIGVYDHEAKRFVAMVPQVGDAYSGVLDRGKKRAIVAAGKLERKDMWEVQPHRARAVLYSLENFGDVLATAKNASPPGDIFYGYEVWVGAEDVLYATRYSVGYAEQNDYIKWTGRRWKKIGWWGLTGDGYRDRRPEEFPNEDPSVKVVDLAEAIYRADTKASFRRGKVGYEGIEDKIKLEKGHHKQAAIYASPDPMIFVVVSNALRFTWDGAEYASPTTRDRHVVDLVDMHEEKATRLAKDKGYCHVSWAPDGTLFLDRPTGVFRYAPGSTEPEADVMPGVRFGTPPFPEEGGA